jgi:uncharacterized protein YbjQ (UPF0145 family)
MITSEIAKQYNEDANQLESFVRHQHEINWSNNPWNCPIIDDGDVKDLLSNFVTYISLGKATYFSNERKKIEMKEGNVRYREAEEMRLGFPNMLVTSGFNFDGYTITKYSGYISGDDADQFSRELQTTFKSAPNPLNGIRQSLSAMRRNALAELKKAAGELHCNAIIGVDFDYLTLDPVTGTSGGDVIYFPYFISVIANGNAVIIKKK